MKRTSLLLTGLFLAPMAHANAAQPKFDLSLIHGASQSEAQQAFLSLLENKGCFLPGTYMLTVVVNDQQVGYQQLVIPKKTKQLDLSPEWLAQAGVNVSPEFYKKYYNKKGNYYNLAGQPNTHIQLNMQQQAIIFTIPQEGISNVTKETNWNEGHTALLLQYYFNATKSPDQKIQYFANGNFSANYKAWRLLGNYNVNNDSSSVDSIHLQRDIKKWKSDLQIGQTNTGTQFYSSVPFTGVALYSNNNMRDASENSYAPIISGTATSNAVITVSQNGYTLEQIRVPAGPYVINNLSLVGNGNVIVKVQYANGQSTTKSVVVNTLPTLLRPKTTNYYVAGGVRKTNDYSSSSSHKKLKFALGEYSHGFSAGTLISGAIVADKYQNVLFGATKSLGKFGALSLRDQVSFAHFNTSTNTPSIKKSQIGQKFTLNYANSFGQNTTLQVSANRYTQNYVGFSNFTTDASDYNPNNEEYKYNINLSQNLNVLNSSINGELWTAHDFDGSSSHGINAYISSSYKQANITTNVSYSKYDYDPKGDLTMSVNVSFPFGGHHNTNPTYLSSGMTYENGQSPSFNVNASRTVNQDFSYNVGGSTSGNNHSLYASTSYTLNAMQLSGSIESDGHGGPTLSVQASGSIIAVHGDKHNHLLFTNSTSNTLAVVNVPGISGVAFNGSELTGKSGVTAVSLSSYELNSLTLDPNEMPNNIQLLDTSWNVVPTDGAIVYKKFRYIKTTTYILQLMGSNGFVVPFGTKVATASGQLVGYTQNHGILVARIVGKASTLLVTVNGTEHKIDLRDLKPNVNTLQKVTYA